MSKYIINVCILAVLTPSWFTVRFSFPHAKFLKSHSNLLDAVMIPIAFPSSFSHPHYIFDTVDSFITSVTSSTHILIHIYAKYKHTHFNKFLFPPFRDGTLASSYLICLCISFTISHFPQRHFPLGSNSLGVEFAFVSLHILII